MAGIRIWGLGVIEETATEEGGPEAFFPGVMEIEVGAGDTVFSYEFWTGPGADEFEADIMAEGQSFNFYLSPTPYQNAPTVSFDSGSADYAMFYELVWGDGFVTQIMEVGYNLPGTSQQAYVVIPLGGMPLWPESPAQLAAMFPDLTMREISDPRFTAGQAISYADLPLYQYLGEATPGQTLDASATPGTTTGGVGDDHITGSAGDDRLVGAAGRDTLIGGAGNDQLLGQGGADALYGGDGWDTIASGDGDDLAMGGAGNDSIGGGLGNDIIFGGADNDIVTGGQGDDLVFGDAGVDYVGGGAGNDTLYGGEGDDTVAGGAGVDYVFGGTGNDNLAGGLGDDTVMGEDGNDTVAGGDGNDMLYGGAGNDTLNGGPGNDLLYGGIGDDRLNGGPGNDTLVGGAGADTFLFNSYAAGARDVIDDFETGVDRVQLSGIAGATAAAKFAGLSITQTADGALLTVGGQTILFDGVAAGTLSAGDFIFA